MWAPGPGLELEDLNRRSRRKRRIEQEVTEVTEKEKGSDRIMGDRIIFDSRNQRLLAKISVLELDRNANLR